jgi:pyochelin biosynthetic protein PchC
MTSTTPDPWLRRFHPSPGAPQLVCFPHAGGAATVYHGLSAELAGRVQVVAVQYPGRQDRFGEAARTAIEELAEPVAEALAGRDRPPALFGHSMGALVAFEVARLLHAAGRPPVALHVSGRLPPQLPDVEALRERTDEQVVAELGRLGGTNQDVLANRSLLEMVLPAIRADYQALRRYRLRPGPVLACPVVALTGDSDPLVTVEQQLGWQDHTTGPFDLRVYPGGHFYLFDHQPALGELLAARIAGATEAR